VRILVLGAAAGGGFPQWNCNCANCRRARDPSDTAARPRTQSSLAVSADGVRWLLLNASPDLRQQIAANPVLHPQAGARHSPIAAVIASNGDVDHVAGLLSLRESQPFAVYATDRVQAVLRSNNIFNVLNADLVPRREVHLEQPTEICDADTVPLGLRITAFAVPGKVALYLEDAKAGPDFGTKAGDTIGLEIVAPATGAKFFYLPACAAMPAELARRLAAAPLLFFDGTLWRDDEMITTGVGSKTGKRMGHMSLSGREGSMTALAPLKIARRIFIHINNTNPILLDDSPERAEAEAAGWEVAYDGQEINL